VLTGALRRSATSATAATADSRTTTTTQSPSWRQSARRWLTHPHVLLVAVCVAHAVLALIYVVAHHMWWEQDETVYISQVAPHSPALVFTPPRARGMPVLLFPVVHFTTSVTIVRTYLVLLGTVAMYAGFRPWLRLGYSRVVPAAAVLLSTLWATTFFGAETQPNFLVAVIALAVVGSFMLALRAPSGRRSLLVLGGWLALMALIRPSDATWLVGALCCAIVVVKGPAGRRRMVVAAALVIGLCLGWSEWVIEAFASYGGFFHRLHMANALNTPGIHFSLLTQASAINGPTLCRPCLGVPVSTAHIGWWFAIPALLALGLLKARGTRRFAPLAIAAAGGGALLLEYVLTVSYAAPRFLLPAYALLSLPCAAGIAALVRWRARTWINVAVILVVGAAIGTQIVTQTHVLQRNVAVAVQKRGTYLTAAAELRAAGVHAPCVIYGYHGPPVGFVLGCNDHPVAPQVLPRVATGTSVVAITTAPDGKTAFKGWEQVKLRPNHSSIHWLAHVLLGGTKVP
jgi:hypothetical protein